MLEAWRLRWEDVHARDEALRREIRALSEDQRLAFYRAYRARLKDPDTYAAVNYFFVTGLHHFYLGRYARGAFALGALLLGVAFLFVQPWLGVVLIVAVLAIELPALTRSQIIVEDYNLGVATQVLECLRHPSGRLRR